MNNLGTVFKAKNRLKNLKKQQTSKAQHGSNDSDRGREESKEVVHDSDSALKRKVCRAIDLNDIIVEDGNKPNIQGDKAMVNAGIVKYAIGIAKDKKVDNTKK